MASGEGLKTKKFFIQIQKPLHKKQPPTSPSFRENGNPVFLSSVIPAQAGIQTPNAAGIYRK